MADRPILFSAPMVRALFDGRERYDIAQHNAARVIRLPDDEVSDRYLQGETIAELAEAFRCSSPTIRKSLDRSGTDRRPAAQRPGRMHGSRNPSWSGGRRQRLDGYWVVWTPEGERLEHRVVMEKHLGRRLLDEEVIHHRDGNKSNNDPTNLDVMTASEHARIHSPQMHAARYGHGR